MSNKNAKNHSHNESKDNNEQSGNIKSSLGGEFEVEIKNTEEQPQSTDNTKNDTIKDIEKQIIQLQDKFNEDKQKLLLAIAERDNAIKRMENDKKEAILFSNQNLLKSLIEPLEYLFLALVQKPDENSSQDYKNMYIGVDMTKTQFVTALEKSGLKRVSPSIGDDFNPTMHEAISAIEDANLKSNTIQNVVKAGYELNGRIIKPALVMVVK